MLQAGWAKVDFTPAGPVPLAGYTHWTDRLSRRVRDPLYVRALALRSGDARFVLVAWDLLMVPEDLYQGMRSRMADTGVKVIAHATHTHSSLGGFGRSWLENRFLGTWRPWALRHLLDAGEQAAREALANLGPAEARADALPLPGLNGNRRDPDGPKDEDLTVLRLVREDGDAVLASYSAHPVIVSERDHHAISADFPGEVIRRLERDFGFAMFVQGALGAVDVLFPADPAMTVDRNLAMMADPIAASAAALARGARSDPSPLVFAAAGWDLPHPDPQPFFDDQELQRNLDLPLRLAMKSLLAGVPRRSRVAGFRVGPFAMVGFPADLGVGIDLALKEHARRRGIRFPIAASQCDGYIGYLHRREDYRVAPPESHRGMAVYENAMGFFGRDMGERVLDAAKTVVDSLVGA